MVSAILFTLLVAAVAFQRLLELRKSEAHRRTLLARGAREHAAFQMPWMAALHTMWLLAMVLEVWLLGRPFALPLFGIALFFFLAGQALRILAMRSLGERWSARVLTLPGEQPVTTGLYRYLRHPNYIGVVFEIAALPLLHSAYLTAILFSMLNGVLLYFRIRAEEAALKADNDYEAAFNI
jgi:methyltransferase